MLPPELSPEQFLAEYWQKKPLFLKRAFADFQDPLSPEELAGLACEAEVEARLVFNQADIWQLKSGPFTEQDFVTLPDDSWTLLVQAVDQWFPAVKQLLHSISFIPDWRLDDVMVSYATETAGVGPHFDYYDVFIIQGQGSRKWQLGQHCDENTALQKNSELKILQDFIVKEEFILEAGDVLYIPPGVAHQGIALDASLSYSVGFRAPSHAEMLSQYAASLCAELPEDQRYSDPDLKTQPNLAEISPATLAKVKTLLTNMLQNDQHIEQSMELWFGQSMTQRKYPQHTYLPEIELDIQSFSSALAQGMELEKHPATRFAFFRKPNLVFLFVDGQSFNFTDPDAELDKLLMNLCSRDKKNLHYTDLQSSQECLTLLCTLYNQGSLIEVEIETDQFS